MTTCDDMTLVREFVASRSEAAFATLVERHIGLVYSAALRQTGDPQLAQEIAQETFLLLARKASFFGPGTVVSAWLYRTTRFLAADAVKARQRRKKRELEAHVQSTPAPIEPDRWAELAPALDSAMAELNESDRTALVLRFFQNKSGREIASALRTGEAAAQKRVTRALEKLRLIFARRGIVLSAGTLASLISENAVEAAPAGLVAAISSAAGKGFVGAVGVGISSKVAALLGKSALFAWVLPLLATLPSLAVTSWLGAVERRNFRDQEGFRAVLHKRWVRSFLWSFPLMFLGILVLNRSAFSIGGMTGQQYLMIALLGGLTLISARSLVIARSAFQVAMFVIGLLTTLGYVAVGLEWVPASWSQFPMLFVPVMLLLVIRKRPARMDYSLLLRAAHDLLPGPPPEHSGLRDAVRDRAQLLAYARFLAARFLVVNHRWAAGGLRLRLAPVPAGLFSTASAVGFWPFGRAGSWVVLGDHGEVSAHCGVADAQALARLQTARVTSPPELEARVAYAVRAGWELFRNAELPAAERALGEAPVSQIFKSTPERAKATLYRQVFACVLAALMLALLILRNWPSPWLEGMHPVQATELEVRGFLSDRAPAPDAVHAPHNSPSVALFTCLIVPSTNLFAPGALEAMRDEVAGQGGFERMRNSPNRAVLVFYSPLPRLAVGKGWISWTDLDLHPDDVKQALRDNRLYSGDDHRFLTRCQAWSWVQEQRFEVLRVQSDGLTQLRLLQSADALDLTHREGLVNQIASAQVLSAKLPDQPRLHHWREVRGLFFTPCFPALQDTYYALAALQILDGLDRIDREACIGGILRRHQGKGYFTSPESGGYNEYHIHGGARDTIAAFESLRLLGALDRVQDLDRWQFRIRSRARSHPAADGTRRLSWEEVEAWVAQERLRQILQARSADSQKPFGSLMEPQAFSP